MSQRLGRAVDPENECRANRRDQSADRSAHPGRLRDQAAAVGAVFVDPIAQGWFVGRPDLIGDDGVHPTDAAHAYMAARIAPLIYDQLTIRL